MNINVVVQYYNYQEATQDAYDFMDICNSNCILSFTNMLAENTYLATVLFLYT